MSETTTETRQAPDIVVERGNPVIATVTFGWGNPDEVFFSYLVPDSERPYVDDGFGQDKTKIEWLNDGVYRYTIDTTDFESGAGTWHFWGKWNTPSKRRPYNKASIFGTYFVLPAPKQLL